MACGILDPWAGIEPTTPALEVWGLTHWTARKSVPPSAPLLASVPNTVQPGYQLSSNILSLPHWAPPLCRPCPEEFLSFFLLLFSHLVMPNSYSTPWTVSHQASSVHGISQARILEWVAIFFSRESSQPRDKTCVSCIGRQILYHRATWEASFPFYSQLFWRAQESG